MKALARLNNCPLTPRKMRLVVDQIRGQKVEDAINLLKFNNKKTYAQYLEKLLLSAVANWEQKNDTRVDDDTNLSIIEAYVNQGRMLKRLRPAPQGRAHRIRKRSNHITIVVDSLSEGENKIEEESKQEQGIES
ncbi:MAG: 50S ribosomal protein L22 [Bacteroidota bacterium]|nr:50S ribosomal protein L22 [Bacteroidota bacterium]